MHHAIAHPLRGQNRRRLLDGFRQIEDLGGQLRVSTTERDG